MKYDQSILDRFHSKYTQESDEECWNWEWGTDKDGYGIFHPCYIDGKQTQVKAHRFMYELVHGSIDENLLICHSCDNPGCINPKHLFQGTDRDNSQDMARKGRQWQQQFDKYPQGHPYNDYTTYRNPNTGKRSCRQCNLDRNNAKRLIDEKR